MFREDAREATPIVKHMLEALLAQAPTRGRPGSDLRTTCGDVIAHAEELLYYDQIGPPLDRCFDLALKTGISIQQLRSVRHVIEAESPTLLGGVLIKDSGIQLILATQSRVLASTRFNSRQEVEQLLGLVNLAFTPAIEEAADSMDQGSYIALVKLYAAVVQYLTETSRPLARMVRYRFADHLPSLAIAYKLYDDTGRADELRAENSIVHPAFMLTTGRALSE